MTEKKKYNVAPKHPLYTMPFEEDYEFIVSYARAHNTNSSHLVRDILHQWIADMLAKEQTK